MMSNEHLENLTANAQRQRKREKCVARIGIAVFIGLMTLYVVWLIT